MALLSKRGKGYLLTILATIAFSNVYIFSKAALNEISMVQFWFYWFLVSAILNTITLLGRGGVKILKTVPKKEFWIFPLLGIMEVFTTLTFFMAIKAIPNPAVTSFLGNLFPMFATILGVIFLHERFSKIESLGVIITLIGAFITSYSGTASMQGFFVIGTGLVVLNTFLAAITTVTVKTRIKRFSPEILNFNRTFWLFCFALGWVIISKEPLAIPASAMKNTIIGAILGPFLAILLVYSGFKYIEASRSTVIQSIKGLIVLLGAFFYFGSFPMWHQVLGGLTSILGIIIMVMGKSKFVKKATN